MDTQIKVVFLFFCLFSSLDARPEEKIPIRIFGSFNGQPSNPFPSSSSGTTTHDYDQGSTPNPTAEDDKI